VARVAIGYDHVNYQALRKQQTGNGENGLWRYSHTIQDKIAPLLETNRPIDALGLEACGTEEHSVVFIHHNVNPIEHYKWLHRHRDLVLVTGIMQTTIDMMKEFPEHHIIHQPVCVDIEEIKAFLPSKKKKRYPSAYFGNQWAFKQHDIDTFVPGTTPRFGKLTHDEQLTLMAKFENIYAVGITAVEAQVLGAKLLVCDSRFPEPEVTFPVVDYREAAKNIQSHLDAIDKWS